MENLNYLFAGYTIFWLLLSLYVFIIGRQQKSIEREIEVLRQEINQ